MIKLSNIARRLATGFVAAQLVFGAVSVSTLVCAAPASAATFLDEHGSWQGFTTTLDGRTVVGALTHMDGGGTAAFLIVGDTFSLVMTDPDWSFKVGRTVPVRVTIDGEVLTGSAVVRGHDFIEMPNLYKNVLAKFVDGAEAKIDVNDGDLLWTLDLHGFTASMSDALNQS